MSDGNSRSDRYNSNNNNNNNIIAVSQKQRHDATKITIEVARGKSLCARLGPFAFSHIGQLGKRRRGGPTDEVWVIGREFIVQFDGVRLVDGVPERGPASNNGVDVFRDGRPEDGIRVPRLSMAGVKNISR